MYHRVPDTGYVARVYSAPVPAYTFEWDGDARQQVVDLKIPPDTSWEQQYWDLGGDFPYWWCIGHTGADSITVVLKDGVDNPEWAEGRFATRRWTKYPYEDRHSFAVTFELPRDWDSVMDETTAHLELRLVEVVADTVAVHATADLRVEPVVGPPEGLGPRPWCQFHWLEELEDSVVRHEIADYSGTVWDADRNLLPGDEEKQIVDMADTYADDGVEGSPGKPVEDLVRWSCRDPRRPNVELGLREDGIIPEWAKDKFSLEIDTRYSEPVVAFEGVPSGTTGATADLALTLTDNVDDMVLKEVQLAVKARCRLVGPERPVTPNCLQQH
ncbi:MAG: hypothetical protein J4F34_06050 [Gemmatimonadetes bacterium]|nr:hypothetical protein [Gemmatimonadota bacterium]